jgi:hypothetical protein
MFFPRFTSTWVMIVFLLLTYIIARMILTVITLNGKSCQLITSAWIRPLKRLQHASLERISCWVAAELCKYTTDIRTRDTEIISHKNARDGDKAWTGVVSALETNCLYFILSVPFFERAKWHTRLHMQMNKDICSSIWTGSLFVV